MSIYADLITEILHRRNAPTIDPRHIEGLMRIQYHTLDHLSRADFSREVDIGIECIREGGVKAAEDLAKSYGL